jgi:hypothetical protein
LKSSKWFWNARTSVGHTKLKAAGMKSRISQGESALCAPGLIFGWMKVLRDTSGEVASQ